jgi:hypothetical protein
VRFSTVSAESVSLAVKISTSERDKKKIKGDFRNEINIAQQIDRPLVMPRRPLVIPRKTGASSTAI